MKAFIPIWLDEAGLSAEAFRVYCHIVRRGRLWSRTERLASDTSISTRKVRKALTELLSAENGGPYITGKARPGYSTIYEVTPSKSARGQDKSARGVEQKCKGSSIDKGYTIKDSPSEEDLKVHNDEILSMLADLTNKKKTA